MKKIFVVLLICGLSAQAHAAEGTSESATSIKPRIFSAPDLSLLNQLCRQGGFHNIREFAEVVNKNLQANLSPALHFGDAEDILPRQTGSDNDNRIFSNGYHSFGYLVDTTIQPFYSSANNDVIVRADIWNMEGFDLGEGHLKSKFPELVQYTINDTVVCRVGGTSDGESFNNDFESQKARLLFTAQFFAILKLEKQAAAQWNQVTTSHSKDGLLKIQELLLDPALLDQHKNPDTWKRIVAETQSYEDQVKDSGTQYLSNASDILSIIADASVGQKRFYRGGPIGFKKAYRPKGHKVMNAFGLLVPVDLIDSQMSNVSEDDTDDPVSMPLK